MSNDQEFSAAVADFESFLAEEAASPTAVGLLPDKAKFCKAFSKAKRVVEPLLPFIGLIPGFGKAAAEAIRVLIKVGDAYCEG